MQQGASDYFAQRERMVHAKRPYLLKHRDQWPENIILAEVSEYIASVQTERGAAGQGFPLHKYIHHGLSSQAMLFNLLGPLIVKNDLALLAPLLPESDLAQAALEYEDRTVFNEDSGQPTSIDLVLLNGAGEPRIFIESKFTETEFGGCSLFQGGDCDGRNPVTDANRCYLHFIGRRYWELMDAHGLLAGKLASETMCIFANHYQFFRELLFALAHDGYFVLLHDGRSPVFEPTAGDGTRGLVPLLRSLLPESIQSRFIVVTMQQVLLLIEQSGRHPWTTAFRAKYGLDDSHD